MIWNKPKKFINETLKVVAIFLFLLTLLATLTLYVWNFKSALINELDNKLLVSYTDSFHKRLLKAINLNQEGEAEKALEILYHLFDRVKSFGKVDRSYQFKLNVMQNIISINMSLKKYDEAIRMAKYWLDSDKKDMNAKITYLNAMSYDRKNHDMVDKEFSRLYEKFTYVDNLAKNYKKFIIRSNNMSRLDNFNKLYFQNNHTEPSSQLSFKMYYIDGVRNTYSEAHSFKVDNIKNNEDEYVVHTKRKFNGLKSLRFDFDEISKEYEIEDFNIEIIGDKKNIKYKLHNLIENNSITEKYNGNFIIKGKDPYFSLNIPSGIKDYTGEMHIWASFKILERDFSESLDSLKNNHEWQVFYTSKNNEFAENNSKKIKFNLLNNDNRDYLWFSNVNLTGSDSISRLRLDFPSSIGLKIKNVLFDIETNEGYRKRLNLTSRSTYMHNISNTSHNKLKITGKDPYMIVDLSKSLLIKKVKITLGQ